MKNFLKLSILSGIALYSTTACQKSNEPLSNPGTQASASIDTSSAVVKALVDSTWFYYEYYGNANNAATTLVWKANKPNNTLDLSLNRVRYFTNGTYTETDQYGSVINGTWELLNSETQIRVYNNIGIGVYTSDIKKLNANELEWHSTTNSGTYGIMRHKLPGIETPAISLLTAQEWKYDAYYSNYNSNSASVQWKTGKSNSLLSMGNMRVKYNADGTYYEVDQSGNYLFGTWLLSGNTLTVYNSFGVGVYASTINVLTSDRLECKSNWSNGGGPFYAEMFH